jgi:NTE family protein
VDILRQAGCPRIVAVDLYRLDQEWEPQTFVHVLVRSLDILLQETVDQDTEGSDVMILQPKIKENSWLSVHHMRVNAAAGQNEVYQQAERLKSFLSNSS